MNNSVTFKEEELCVQYGIAYIVRTTTSDIIDDIREQGKIIKDMPIGITRTNAMDEFKQTYGIDLYDIIGVGTSEINVNLVKNLIPHNNKTGYKCFVRDTPSPYVKLHEDIRSSWNCLIEKLGRPTHLILYKKRV